jgi:hypothetical protein
MDDREDRIADYGDYLKERIVLIQARPQTPYTIWVLKNLYEELKRWEEREVMPEPEFNDRDSE